MNISLKCIAFFYWAVAAAPDCMIFRQALGVQKLEQEKQKLEQQLVETEHLCTEWQQQCWELREQLQV